MGSVKAKKKYPMKRVKAGDFSYLGEQASAAPALDYRLSSSKDEDRKKDEALITLLSAAIEILKNR